ncbi:hypothetical protein Fmac_032149 [Flemingia macrophylla]|uniref:Uncharacterized protein n=1 Tax=Flemingia macrophylla TaxID=520843 RepID=A0ABD1L4G9_9FABA
MCDSSDLACLPFPTSMQGAATACYVALHPQVKGISDKYFSDCNLAKTTSQS